MRFAAMVMMSLLVAVNAAQGREEAPDGLPLPVHPAPGNRSSLTIYGPEAEKVCAGTVRPGWVRVDEVDDDSGKCQDPGEGKHKAWLITKLDEVPDRQALAICKVKVVPLYWFQWRAIRDRNVCRDSAPEGEDNVMIIYRGKNRVVMPRP